MLGLSLFLKANKWPLLLIILLVFSHGLIYRLGHTVSTIESKDAIIENQKLVADQVSKLSTLSTTVSVSAKANTKTSEVKMNNILTSIKDKPLTTLVDGKCQPTDDFIDAYIAIVKEGNTK